MEIFAVEMKGKKWKNTVYLREKKNTSDSRDKI